MWGVLKEGGEGLCHLCQSGGVAAHQACLIVRKFAPEKIAFRPFGETVTREKTSL